MQSEASILSLPSGTGLVELRRTGDSDPAKQLCAENFLVQDVTKEASGDQLEVVSASVHITPLYALADAAANAPADLADAAAADSAGGDALDVECDEASDSGTSSVASSPLPLPLLLRLQHSACAADLERLVFRRADAIAGPFEVVEGGTFSSAGWAEVEVAHFSVWQVALLSAAAAVQAAAAAQGVSHLYVDDQPVSMEQVVPVALAMGAAVGAAAGAANAAAIAAANAAAIAAANAAAIAAANAEASAAATPRVYVDEPVSVFAYVSLDAPRPPSIMSRLGFSQSHAPISRRVKFRLQPTDPNGTCCPVAVPGFAVGGSGLIRIRRGDAVTISVDQEPSPVTVEFSPWRGVALEREASGRVPESDLWMARVLIPDEPELSFTFVLPAVEPPSAPSSPRAGRSSRGGSSRGGSPRGGSPRRESTLSFSEEEAEADPEACDFFLSHTQRDPVAKLLATEIYSGFKDMGMTCWLDVKMDACDMRAMEDGVKKCKTFIAIFTDDSPRFASYLSRPMCLEEIAWAIKYDKPIVPVCLREDKLRIGDFIEAAKQAGFPQFADLNFCSFDRSGPRFTTASLETILDGAKRMKQSPTKRSRSRSAELPITLSERLTAVLQRGGLSSTVP